MNVESLSLQNFRNHKRFSSSFDRINYIEGANGSGKTAVIEAVHILLTLKTFRRQAIKSIINFDEDYLRIEGVVNTLEHKSSLVYFFDSDKTLKKDGDLVTSTADYLYNNPVVTYSPEGVSILSKEQQYRRAFIDRLAFFLDKQHLINLNRFKKIIMQKSALLSQKRVDESVLDIINAQLIEVSQSIRTSRQGAVDALNEKLLILYESTGFLSEAYKIRYTTNTCDTSLLQKEPQRGICLYGPQRDRFYSTDKTRVYDKFSSYGQSKTFVLLTLFANLLILEQKLKTDIIFLLDDFEAGLDKNRINTMKNIFSDQRQLIITGVNNQNFNDVNTITI